MAMIIPDGVRPFAEFAFAAAATPRSLTPPFPRFPQYCCPSDRAHITKAINAIKETKNKEFRDFGRKLDQKGGALSLV